MKPKVRKPNERDLEEAKSWPIWEKEARARHPRLQRFTKFILSAFIIYFVFKVPIMWFLTDLLAVHYIWSGFVAGSILTLLSFIPSEFWVWKKKL